MAIERDMMISHKIMLVIFDTTVRVIINADGYSEYNLTTRLGEKALPKDDYE